MPAVVLFCVVLSGISIFFFLLLIYFVQKEHNLYVTIMLVLVDIRSIQEKGHRNLPEMLHFCSYSVQRGAVKKLIILLAKSKED